MTMYRTASYLILYSIFFISTTNGQTKPEPSKNWNVDKVEFHRIMNDSMQIVLEDYQRTIILDSVWRQELANDELSEHFEEIIKDSLPEQEIIREIPTEVLKERLAKLNAKTPFNIEYNESLESVIGYFLRREKESTERLMALSKFYFPMFESTFDRYNVPLEMKYLALVESALNPRAKSRVGATGLWQFMYNTGKAYDLDVNSYVDERMDPLASTEAAAKYLKRLHEMFDDWDLALAAYNSGMGNVSKAIRRSGGNTNFWEIRKFLPRETAGYVPSFQAIMYIFEYAEEHGFVSQKPKIAYIGTDTIRTKKKIKLEHIAEAINIDLEFLEFLNPSYKLGVIPYETEKKYYLRLPYIESGVFVANEDKIYNFTDEKLAKSEEESENEKVENKIDYYVKSGDYLGRIATKFGVGVSQIKSWNNLYSNNLSVGQKLVIFSQKQSAVASSNSENSKTDSSTSREFYKVKSGDSLWTISRKFPNLSVEDLKNLNDLSSSKLKPGMKLKVNKG
ncbi:lytic transglycosylase domain-containing protein [Psychroflexus aestuariivivens]|uniref:lytic transglycosylase domain-containing protein n=1 Tax=Psychroflexus aestuariivivens TaxID=1795040 RepID=UPI000FDC704B|nr:lytic transglycosylase domain-containing protein [Psychroflexus aestuariivivens]